MAAPAIDVDLYLPTATAFENRTISCTITRGRQSPLFDDFQVGVSDLVLNNEDRQLDPLYSSGTYFGDLIPGVRCRIRGTPSGGSATTIFDGAIEDFGFEYPNQRRSVATISAVDALATLGRARFDEWTTTYGEYPGARITTALARPEVNYTGSTSLDTGVTPLQADYVSWDSNVLNYLQLVARTDAGLLFSSRTNVVTYLDRLSFISAATAAAFGTGGIGFSSIRRSSATALWANRASIARVRGPYEEDDPTPQVVSDSTSISTYGRTASYVQTDLLMQSDEQAEALAQYVVDRYKDPLNRIEALTLEVHGLSTAQQATVLALDLGDIVTVTWTPNSVGSAIVSTCVVEGITHSILPGFHEMVLTLNDGGLFATADYFEPNAVSGFGAFSASTQSYPFPPF